MLAISTLFTIPVVSHMAHLILLRNIHFHGEAHSAA